MKDGVMLSRVPYLYGGEAMLYIIKSGKTLHVQEAHRCYQVIVSLERLFDGRLEDELTTLKGRQAALKKHSTKRYNLPLYVNDQEVYFSTSSWRLPSTVLINAVRVISIEPHGLHTHILFDQGNHLLLEEEPRRLKKRWAETLQFAKKITLKN